MCCYNVIAKSPRVCFTTDVPYSLRHHRRGGHRPPGYNGRNSLPLVKGGAELERGGGIAVLTDRDTCVAGETNIIKVGRFAPFVQSLSHFAGKKTAPFTKGSLNRALPSSE